VTQNAFTVDPSALRQLASALGVLSTRLEEARALTKRVDSGDFGDGRLADATSRFTEHWAWQAEKLSTTLEDVSGRLDDAAGQYQSVEDTQLAAQGQGTAG
jgi:hypothetical protein